MAETVRASDIAILHTIAGHRVSTGSGLPLLLCLIILSLTLGASGFC